MEFNQRVEMFVVSSKVSLTKFPEIKKMSAKETAFLKEGSRRENQEL